jgi:hypothetical protein
MTRVQQVQQVIAIQEDVPCCLVLGLELCPTVCVGDTMCRAVL